MKRVFTILGFSWVMLLVSSSGCDDEGDSSGTGGEEPAGFDAYPANLCVGEKQAAAGEFCLMAFGAWAEGQDDPSLREESLRVARDELSRAWTEAEDRAAGQGADCADLALRASEASEDLEASIEATLGALGLGLGGDTACESSVLEAAGSACRDLLMAEGRHIRSLDEDSEATTLRASRDDALDELGMAAAAATEAGCLAGDEALVNGIEGLVGAFVQDTLVTPGLDDARYTALEPGPTEYQGRTLNPTCVQGSPYRFFARRGSVNKLLIYYQGGGACWNSLTCGIPSCRALPNDDLAGFAADGFFDLQDERNPFRDWNIVFVSYCTCDIHFGDAVVEYTAGEPTRHLGYHNARVAEKWAREHFLNPEAVFVTGSSAGAYGAWFHGPLLHEVWPASQIHVLADAGNGVITEDFLQNEFSNWNFVENLPEIPGVLDSIVSGGGMPEYTVSVATAFPDTNWAHYTAFYDGSPGGQSGFYNVMLNDGNPAATLRWWDASCAFGENALMQAEDTFAALLDNYRYYFGSGTAHTAFRNDKVYDDTTGGVPTLVDWVGAMLASGPDERDAEWSNVLCTDCGLLLEGDPRPAPLEPPFEERGEDVVVACEP